MPRHSWILALLLVLAPAAAAQAPLVFPRDEVTVATAAGDEHRFRVEVARTPQQQSQGLMYRREMAPDAGMLFVLPYERVLGMWMRNTYIPLDMIFIGRGGEIVKIAERTVPLSTATISSGRRVAGVLEVNAGTAQRLGIAVGDRVVHPAFD